MSIAVAALTGAVRTYQYTLRPFIGANCRFEPSCSHYAIEALRVHGAGRGSLLAARRVLRCNPWTPGGDDPVPPSERSHSQRPRSDARQARTGA
jgi:putative membrane protein insertion efficiency factor